MAGSSLPLDKAHLLHAYRTMKTIREFEERLHVDFSRGDIPGFVHLYAGEEASATGIMMHLHDGDRIASTHRGHGHCISKGVDVIDCSAEVAKNPDFLLTVDHIKAWEAKHGAIEKGSWVVMRSDWYKRNGSEKDFLNADENGPHSPGPTAEACQVPAEHSDTAWTGEHGLAFLRAKKSRWLPQQPLKPSRIALKNGDTRCCVASS